MTFKVKSEFCPDRSLACVIVGLHFKPALVTCCMLEVQIIGL